MEASGACVPVKKPRPGSGPFLLDLPSELLLEIITHLEDHLRSHPRLLTLCKTWYTIAWPVFSTVLSLTDVQLWKYMDCTCCLMKSLRKMVPHIRSFRFTRQLSLRCDLEDQLYEDIPHVDSDPDDGFECAGYLTLCAARALSRRLKAKDPYQVYEKLERKLCRLVETVVSHPQLRDVQFEVVDPDFGEPTNSPWYSKSIMTLLAFDHFPSLRLSVTDLPWKLQQGRFCEEMARQLTKRKKVFVSANQICKTILGPSDAWARLPIEQLTIAFIHPPLWNDSAPEPNNCQQKNMEWGTPHFENFRWALSRFAESLPNAQYVRIAGITCEPVFLSEPQYRPHLVVWDAVSGLRWHRSIREYLDENTCLHMWNILQHEDFPVSLDGVDNRMTHVWDGVHVDHPSDEYEDLVDGETGSDGVDGSDDEPI